MKIGIACPYSWDVPGGVQFHIRDLALELIRRGHKVSVIAPCSKETEAPEFLVPTEPAIPVRYNGSVARLSFGPRVNHQVTQWLKKGAFDILHVHEPAVPSVSMLALRNAKIPVVATFHSAMESSRALKVASPIIRPAIEKISARIAVSDEARRTVSQFLGGDAYVIPNGVYTRHFENVLPNEKYCIDNTFTCGFLGRYDEPRKGLSVLAKAFAHVHAQYPHVKLLIAGPGDERKARLLFDQSLQDSVEFVGMISDDEKAQFFSSIDAYIAPNTGGESFGIILIEAMSAGSYVIASDIPAFAAVLGNGVFGALFTNGNDQALAKVLIHTIDAAEERQQTSQKAQAEALRYDWFTVTSQVVAVYETARRMYGGN
ncbi:MAG: glycosyltransferase family 4 protein [Actinomycetaceae bacterium]|nr:glycosyltransferase family 4 protein [Actinomycetaceae bacterium]